MHLGGRDVERGVHHAERREDALVQEVAQRLSGDLLDQIALHVDGRAVRPHGLRLGEQRHLHELVDHRLQRCAGVQHPIVDERAVDRMAGVQDVAQPGGVLHQVAHRHAPAPLDRLGLHVPVGVLPGVDLEIGERRNVSRHRIVELPLAFLVQHHQRHADDRLGHREDAEDRIGLDRIVLADIELADRVAEDQLAVPRQHRDDAGQLAVVDHRLHAGVEPLQPFRRDPDVFRCGDLEIAREFGRRRALERGCAGGHRRQQRREEQVCPPPGQTGLHRDTS